MMKTFSEQAILGILLSRIEWWSKQYEISFQVWGEGNNNVFVNHDDVDIYSSGGWETVEEMFNEVLKWCERSNPSKKYPSWLQGTNPEQ